MSTRLEVKRPSRKNTAGLSPRRKALVIGVNYQQALYPTSWGPISGQKDADEFYRFLTQDYIWNPEDIVLMKDHEDVPEHLIPTRENLIRELKALVQDACPGDRFVLFFAGHSDQFKSLEDPLEEDEQDEVIIPCDIPVGSGDYKKHAIVDNQLKKWVVDPLPKECTLTAIFDTCHSGTLLDLRHHHCNKAFVPWVSKGPRRSRSRWEKTDKRNAAICEAKTESIICRLNTLSSSDTGTRCTISDEHDSDCSTPDSPVAPQCMSPQPLEAHECTGWCEPVLHLDQANVVSLSACADNDTVWEGKGGKTMTSYLIDILRDSVDHQLSYREVLTQLSHCLHDARSVFHDEAKKYRFHQREVYDAAGRVRSNSELEVSNKINFTDFQDPQLCSHVPLNMDDPFIL